MARTDIMALLNSIGLTQYESKVYTTLATLGTASAKDVSTICNIPYGKIYEVLSTLEKKGFVETVLSRPMKFTAVNPNKVMQSVKENEIKKINKIKHLLLDEFNDKSTSVKKGGFVLIKGMHILDKLKQTMVSAKKEVLVYSSDKCVTKVEKVNNLLNKLSKKGVKVKIKFPKKKIRSNFIVVDKKEAIVFVLSNDNLDILHGVWTNSSFFVELLLSFFYSGNSKV